MTSLHLYRYPEIPNFVVWPGMVLLCGLFWLWVVL